MFRMKPKVDNDKLIKKNNYERDNWDDESDEHESDLNQINSVDKGIKEDLEEESDVALNLEGDDSEKESNELLINENSNS